MIVRHQAFGHRHGIERNAGSFDQLLDFVVNLSVSGAFAEKNSRAFGGSKHFDRSAYRFVRRYYRRAKINGFEEKLIGIRLVHNRTQARFGNIEIYAAGTARDSCTVRADNSSRYILRLVDTICGFYKALGDIELISLCSV